MKKNIIYLTFSLICALNAMQNAEQFIKDNAPESYKNVLWGKVDSNIYFAFYHYYKYSTEFIDNYIANEDLSHDAVLKYGTLDNFVEILIKEEGWNMHNLDFKAKKIGKFEFKNYFSENISGRFNEKEISEIHKLELK